MILLQRSLFLISSYSTEKSFPLIAKQPLRHLRYVNTSDKSQKYTSHLCSLGMYVLDRKSVNYITLNLNIIGNQKIEILLTKP